MASLRSWSEDHSAFIDILKDEDFTIEKAHTLAETYFSDHVQAAAGIVMPEETMTDPDVFYDGILDRDGRYIGGAPLKDARPGDIILTPSRVVPLPDREAANSQSMEEFGVVIQGREVQCYHLTKGVMIRVDDFEDLLTFVHKDLTDLEGKSTNTRGGVLQRNSSALLIRSLWPSQSWVFITSFRAKSNRRLPPFHTVRFEAAKCVLEEIYKRWRCADGQKGRRKNQPVNPDWLGIAKVKERIRNVVKHTNQSRKERLTKATGASAGFMKQYATVAEKVETEAAERRREELFRQPRPEDADDEGDEAGGDGADAAVVAEERDSSSDDSQSSTEDEEDTAEDTKEGADELWLTTREYLLDETMSIMNDFQKKLSIKVVNKRKSDH